MTFEFDPNRPPRMPPSALLYSPTWMRLVHRHAPWMVCLMTRHARRDARQCALWIRFYVVKWFECLYWHQTHTIRWAVQPATTRERNA